jgi:hypothetical protein
MISESWYKPAISNMRPGGSCFMPLAVLFRNESIAGGTSALSLKTKATLTSEVPVDAGCRHHA